MVGVKKLDLVESTFADTTATIPVSLWGNLIPVVETGKVYHIIPIQVRTWNGVKKLTTSPSSVVTEVVDQPELNVIPLRESTNNDQEAANVVITVPSIHSVHSVETFAHCINCGRRFTQQRGSLFSVQDVVLP